MPLQRLVAAGVPLAAAGLHGSRAPAACAAAEPRRGLPMVDVRLHAHQLLFGRFLLAAAEEVSRLQATACRRPRPSVMNRAVHEVSCCDALTFTAGFLQPPML